MSARSSASTAGLAIDRDRQKGQAPDSDQRRALRQPERRDQRIAVGVPRKSGEQVAAQPLGDGEGDREREHARRAARPDQPRQREPQRGKERQAGRQPDDRERQQPAEDLGVDQKRVADPIEAGEEIAEAEPPARGRRRHHAAEAPGGGAIDQPDQDREGEERHRPHVERRQRQRRGGARKECDQHAPPAPGQHDRVGEAGERHGLRRISMAGRRGRA